MDFRFGGELDDHEFMSRVRPLVDWTFKFISWLIITATLGWQPNDTDALPTYLHVFEDGRRVPAKAYPESLLADFRKHFREEWLPNRALDYFRRRDSEALQYLPKLIANNKPKKLN